VCWFSVLKSLHTHIGHGSGIPRTELEMSDMDKQEQQSGRLLTHPRGLLVDPALGLVYGKRGKPFRKLARGYVQANIPGNSRPKNVGVHRLIWEAVHGPIPAGKQINHINAKKADNRIENLECVTPAENTKHAYRHGCRSAAGASNGRAKITASDASAIRETRGARHEIAATYGITRDHVSSIRNGRYWPAQEGDLQA
jgi:hypothetical protein